MLMIISNASEEANRLAETFSRMGLLAVGMTAEEALGEPMASYAAILLAFTSGAAEATGARELEALFAKNACTPPLFALGDAPNLPLALEGAYPRAAYAPSILSDMTERLAAKGRRKLGAYRLGELDASAELPTPALRGEPLPLTRTETMIVRALLRAYPMALSAERILRYAFRQSRLPCPASIRTHVSIINKKCRINEGRNIIASKNECGYVITVL